MLSTLTHDQCVNKQFSVVFYIVADTVSPTYGITNANLDSAIIFLNRAFSRICVSFAKCSTVVIPDFNYNLWRATTTESVVINNYNTANTINVYLPETIATTSNGGYTYLPGNNPKNVVVLEKDLLTLNTSSVSIIHEMGHFFGLVHTSDEIGAPVNPPPPTGVTSYEFVNRSNCNANGDGFCDTEADCYPLPAGTKDGNNDYYILPKDNFMSRLLPDRCRFSQEQYNFMAAVIISQMLTLN